MRNTVKPIKNEMSVGMDAWDAGLKPDSTSQSFCGKKQNKTKTLLYKLGWKSYCLKLNFITIT